MAQRKKTDVAEPFRLMVEGAPNAMVMVDERGLMVVVNQQTEKLFGYSRQELLGRPVEMLVPGRLRAKHPRYRRDFQARPKTRAMGAGRDLFGLRKDGSEVPIEIGLNPIKRGKKRLVLASIVDITERKRAEERFRLAVEAAPNALIMTDGGGRMVLVNSQAEKLFGYAREEMIGRTIELLLPRRVRERHVAYRGGYMAQPSTRAMGAGRDLFGLRKDGSEVPVEIGLNPFRTEEGAFVLASIVDITDRKRLERRVAQNEALASIGGMMAVVAHEIRNPLGSIVMAAKNLAVGDLSPEDREQVMDVLIKESQRLNGTLEDLLQFARPREPRRETADLNATAREVLAAVRSDSGLAGSTRVEQALDKDLAPFPFDVDQIRRVLWNLLRNAFQAVGGAGRVKVTTQARGGEAVFHVDDSGPGIPSDQLDKLFTPFHTTKAKGTGLGLPISRSIVVAHGGEIRVETRPGRGSRFTVALPLSDEGSAR